MMIPASRDAAENKTKFFNAKSTPADPLRLAKVSNDADFYQLINL
jgi:hypothetical protein